MVLDAYAVLGLEKGVPLDIEEARRAYRAACIKWHPDKNPEAVDVAELKFKEIQLAFRHLTILAAGGEDAKRVVAEDASSAAEAFSSQLPAHDERRERRWHDGKPKLQIGDGILFVGEVSGGRPHGGGELILKDGTVHRGNFDSGRAAGRGILFSASGTVFKGSWIENRRTGEFEVLDPKGERWHDVYDDTGKRTKRVRATTIEAADAREAQARAEAEAAEAVAEAVRAVAPTRPVALTVEKTEAALAAVAAAEAAAPAATQALLQQQRSPSDDPYGRMTPAQRRAAAERNRLAGAAARAERTRVDGGGFAGYSPPVSPRPMSPVAPPIVDDTSLFGSEAAQAAPRRAAVACRRCAVRFHTAHNSTCRYHNSEWMDVPPPVDDDEFPDGGMWRCCGRTKKDAEGCTLGVHEPRAFGPHVEGAPSEAPAAASVIPSPISID